ncbi:MAG TPA: cardiolipin synthase ClsB [Gallionellaceae bacterium]|nr:cardiolipin synthase ClsB [Gallionellaceae bacterium]
MKTVHQVAGHSITLLRNGEEYFPRLIEAIDDATYSVYLETYIYADDASGDLVSAALRRAVQRGVAVRVLLDGFGSAELPQQWVDDMRSLGMEVMWFRQEVGRFSLQRYHLRRLHRKLAVIDGRVGFVGGINIIDDTPDGLDAPRLDYAVQVEGEVVRDIHASMLRLWLLVAWTQFRRNGQREKIRRLTATTTQQQVGFLMRDNFRHRRDIERAYLNAIVGARREIIIANAYFLPGRRFRHALLAAARRGVRVVLLLQGRVEYRLQHYATLALYDELLRAGIEIHEYRASFMHAKVAVVDGEWATVGSSNIDPFSLWLAREANLSVQDAGFAAELRDDLLSEMQHRGRRVARSLWRNLNVFGWLAMRLSYVLARLVAGVLVYQKGQDDI